MIHHSNRKPQVGAAAPGKEKNVEEDKKQKYEDYIRQSSSMAAVIGRRVPYHLEYIRKHGAGPVPEGNREYIEGRKVNGKTTEKGN